MADWTHRYAKLSYPRRLEQAPASRLALDQPSNQRLVHRLRVLIDADERVIRPRPITLPPLKGSGGAQELGGEAENA